MGELLHSTAAALERCRLEAEALLARPSVGNLESVMPLFEQMGRLLRQAGDSPDGAGLTAQEVEDWSRGLDRLMQLLGHAQALHEHRWDRLMRSEGSYSAEGLAQPPAAPSRPLACG